MVRGGERFAERERHTIPKSLRLRSLQSVPGTVEWRSHEVEQSPSLFESRSILIRRDTNNPNCNLMRVR
jgi:hypothetical protein